MHKRLMILCSIAINWLLMAIYCRIERKIDNKKFVRDETNKLKTDNSKIQNKIFFKSIYNWINAYIYGWVRYNTLLTGYIPSYRIQKSLFSY